MTEIEKQSFLARFLQKFGTVSAAAAALWAGGTANAREVDVIKSLMNNTASVNFDERKRPLAGQLVLKSHWGSGIMSKGGRGHSSHSSHSSHRSHVSSSSGMSRQLSPSDLDDDSTPLPRSKPAARSSSKPSKNSPEQVETTPPVKSTPKTYTPPDGVDLDDPEKRYQLFNITNTAKGDQAFIRDLKVGKTALYAVDEEIGDYTVQSIKRSDMKVIIVSKDGKELTITKLKVKK